MKRSAAILIGLFIVSIIGAQELKIGTIEGMAGYGPLVVKVLKEAGFDAKISTYPIQGDLVRELAKGGIDGAFFLAQPIIAQAKGAVRVPVRIGESNFCAVATDPSVKVANPGDLRKYKVAIVKGHPAHAAITRGLTLTGAASDEEQFKLLADGSVQVVIAVDDLIPIMCKAVGIKQYYVQNPPLLRTPTFLALSAAQAGIEPKVEAAFKKWIDNGQWEAEMTKIAGQAKN
jgi:hypothetical protein